jgi:hypothetical protein
LDPWPDKLKNKIGAISPIKPTNSTYSFVTDNPVIEHLGPVSFIGVQHGRHNTEDYNSDEVEAMARKLRQSTHQFTSAISSTEPRRIGAAC